MRGADVRQEREASSNHGRTFMSAALSIRSFIFVVLVVCGRFLPFPRGLCRYQSPVSFCHRPRLTCALACSWKLLKFARLNGDTIDNQPPCMLTLRGLPACVCLFRSGDILSCRGWSSSSPWMTTRARHGQAVATAGWRTSPPFTRLSDLPVVRVSRGSEGGTLPPRKVCLCGSD